MPTKVFPTQKAIAWAKKLVLPKMDRFEVDYLLADLERIEQRMGQLQGVIVQRCSARKDAKLLTSMPGVSHFTAARAW